jgi:hypothetical protein
MIRTLQFLLAAIVACALSAAGGAYVGWSKRGTQAALEQAAAVAKAEKKAREVSDHLAERIHQLDAERVAESENARKNNELYHAALRDRSVRLSILSCRRSLRCRRRSPSKSRTSPRGCGRS